MNEQFVTHLNRSYNPDSLTTTGFCFLMGSEQVIAQLIMVPAYAFYTIPRSVDIEIDGDANDNVLLLDSMKGDAFVVKKFEKDANK